MRNHSSDRTGIGKENTSLNTNPFPLLDLPTFRLSAKRATRGYALLDVIVALTVFSLWGVSLMGLLRDISIQSESYSRDRLIQYQLQSLITEARHKEVTEIPGEYLDESLGITFTTTIEALQLANIDGNALSDLYTVKVIAEFEEKGEPQVETAEVYLYKPEEDQ